MNLTFIGALSPGNVRLLSSSFLLVPQERWEPRSYYERWFSRPWRPWQWQKKVVDMVPDLHLYRLPDGSFVGHPQAITHAMQTLGDMEREVFRATLHSEWTRRESWTLSLR